MTRLADRRSRYDRLDAYFLDEASVPILSTQDVRDAYRQFRQLARMNFAELIVESTRERMVPVGFRTGADGEQTGDSEAWRIWQANQLDADAPLVHRTSLALGDSYVIVGPVDPEIGAPLITPEDPREVLTEHDPAHRRRVVAGIKAFHDDVVGRDLAYLYLPGVVLRASRRHADGRQGVEGYEWDGEAEPLGISGVPVVRFANKAGLSGESRGEFETHLGALDRINYLIFQRLQIVTLQAFRQRAIKGVEPFDEAGDPIDFRDIFRSDPASLWLLPETAEMWESGQVDLTPIQTAIRDDVQNLAAVTRTPMHYLVPEAANGSAEGASLAREGLVFKVQDRTAQAGESWEQVMALAFAFAGDATRARRADMETLWAPPDRFSLAERYDAASKAQAAGVPWRQIMLDILQFSPQVVARMESERLSDAFAMAPVSDVPFEPAQF